jgi:hypothetical protein
MRPTDIEPMYNAACPAAIDISKDETEMRNLPTLRSNVALGLKLFLAVHLALASSTAVAYIDPNIGGYIYQILFPIVTAVMAGFIFLRDRIATILRLVFPRKSKPEHQDKAPTQTDE